MPLINDKSHSSLPPDQQVRAFLNVFFQRYLVERDAPRTLELLSDQVYSVGTGEGEVAVGKEAFADLLGTELTQLPGPIFYTMSDYVQKERVPGCWDCFCHMEMSLTLPDGTQALYHTRVTAGLHWDGRHFLIDTIHASEASKYQENGEFFPLKFISQGLKALSRETRHELMELIEQIMPGGIVGGYMEEGFPLYVANERLLNMAEYESYKDFEDDIQGLVINSIHPDDRAYVNAEMAEILAQGDQYEIEYRMKKKDGSYFWVHDIGRRTVAADGRDAIISVLIDVSQQVHTKARLEYAALSDPLTGILNRKGVQSRIAEAMANPRSYLFFMLDLDNFKQINDLYGHKQGDEVLCFVARHLTESFRKTDAVCRLGGDEFAVFIADCANVPVIQRKIGILMEDYREMVQSHYPAARSTLSVGGVSGSKSRTFIELYQLADAVLYEVKNSQKGLQKFRILE